MVEAVSQRCRLGHLKGTARRLRGLIEGTKCRVLVIESQLTSGGPADRINIELAKGHFASLGCAVGLCEDLVLILKYMTEEIVLEIGSSDVL